MHIKKGFTSGRVREIRFGAGKQVEVSIACPAGAIPRPGQYLLVSNTEDVAAPLSTLLFMMERSTHGFWAAPLGEAAWSPGTRLELAGPLGHGFDELPASLPRLGLVAMGETVARLLPLIQQWSQVHTALTLFTDVDIPALPSSVEVFPLASLPEALEWPDYLILDVPLRQLEQVRQALGLALGAILPYPAQVLVTSPFPCVGLGQCGACAVRTHRGWKLACEDGPVFNLASLYW